MTITASFVLPTDLVIVPASELPADVQEQAGCTEEDFAVTRPGARTTSRIIDPHAAELLEGFRSPRTIVEVVIKYSREHGLDPEETLVEAYPLLQSFIASRLLVPADSVEADTIGPSLAPSEIVLSWEIVRAIQILEDVEVYQVRYRDGEPAALKIKRPGSHARVDTKLKREMAVLQQLGGEVGPLLLDAGSYNERSYLLMEWLSGVDCSVAAGEIRDAGPGGREDLLALCGAILHAYAQLHDKEVIHGDIHPRNILVSADGSVKIIDYGMARLQSNGATPQAQERGGVGFFLEPEYAQAYFSGQQPPHASFLGEQYGLASLLYYLLTGNYYLDFSLEHDEMLRQIVEDEPLPFGGSDTHYWIEVENVVHRGLSKDPAKRFGSVAEFAARFEEACASACERSHETAPKVALLAMHTPAQKLVDELIQHVEPGRELFTAGLSTAPICSVKVGAAGIAYALYRIACVRAEPRLLSHADLWINKALYDAARDDAFTNAEIEITPDTVGQISPYHTLSGLFAVQAFISSAMGDLATQQAAIEGFVAESSQEEKGLDVTLGRSGTLLIGALLLDSVLDRQLVDCTSLLALGNRTAQSINAELASLAPIPACSDIEYLGMAHGWAGFLYAQMRWSQAAGSDLPGSIPERLEELAWCAEPIGRGARWKWVLTDSSRGAAYMPGWCNGSAGYVFLWTQAYQTLGDERYLELAEQAAWNSWEESAGAGNLCCGQSGRAYSLLNLFKHTREQDWLVRAQTLLDRSVEVIESSEYPRESLYKGELGVAVLAADIEEPETSAMPFFEREWFEC